MLSRLENDILGNEAGLQAFEAALTRSTDTLLKRKNKERLSIDLDSTEDPAHGKQEWVADNGHVAKHCGAVYSNFYKTVFFQGHWCYHGADYRIRLQEQELWGIFPGTRGQKTKLDCGGQACRLIPD